MHPWLGISSKFFSDSIHVSIMKPPILNHVRAIIDRMDDRGPQSSDTPGRSYSTSQHSLIILLFRFDVSNLLVWLLEGMKIAGCLAKSQERFDDLLWVRLL
jgi:hypothetical protein